MMATHLVGGLYEMVWTGIGETRPGGLVNCEKDKWEVSPRVWKERDAL